MDVMYSIQLEQKFVGYSPRVDEIFIFWCDGEIIHCLGQQGKYQVCFIDEISDELFIELGDY